MDIPNKFRICQYCNHMSWDEPSFKFCAKHSPNDGDNVRVRIQVKPSGSCKSIHREDCFELSGFYEWNGKEVVKK